MADDLSVLAPAVAGVVMLGDGDAAIRVEVRPLKLRQLPAFTAALRPLADRISAIMDGGIDVGAIMDLVEHDFERVLEVLHSATGAPRAALEEATIDQALELVLAVISANKDFLRGRLLTAVRTAATLTAGAGPTPSQP